MSEQFTKQDYVDQMQSMFQSAGWRRWLKPRLREMRTLELLAMVYTYDDGAEIRAARKAIQILDSMLDIEAGVQNIAKEILDDPQDAGSVVEYPHEDPQPQGLPLGDDNA